MSSEVIVICGKICSGKSTYTERLRVEKRAVVLSCDELVLGILGDELGDRHDEILERVKAYLYAKAVEVLEAGVSVILEWGFWKKSDRDFVRSFFGEKGYTCQLHYIDISDDQWKANIAKRNRAVFEGRVQGYFVDEGLLAKLEQLFEAPDSSEVDVTVRKILCD